MLGWEAFPQAFPLIHAQPFLSNGQIPSSVPILFSVLLRPTSQKLLLWRILSTAPVSTLGSFPPLCHAPLSLPLT